MISRLSKNIIYNLFGQGLVTMISLLAVKLIFHRLGAEALGIIYFTTAVNAILIAALEMGVSTTIVREISGHIDSDKNYIKDFIRTFSFFYWGICALGAAVIFFLAPFFVHHWIHLSKMSPVAAINILRILGISSIIILPRSFYSSLISGLQKMGFNNLINVVCAGLQQFGAFLILFLGGGLFPVIYWFAIINILWVTIYFFASAKFFSFLALIPKFSFVVIKRNFKFISSTALISIFSTIHAQISEITVSKFLPIATLGYYSFSYGGVSQGGVLGGAVAQASYPSFSALAKAGNKDGLMSQYHKLQDLVCFGTLLIFAAVPFVTIPLFSYLFNRDVANSLLLPTTLLSLGFYMNGTGGIPCMFSFAVGKPGIIAKTNFYSLFITLPAAVILIYYFGLVGAGLSWIFYNIFGYLYGLPRICKECLGIRVRDWYFHVLKIFILAVAVYGTVWTVLILTNNYSIFALIMAYLSASIIFLFCSYFLITKDFKETIFYYLRLIKIPK